MWKIESIQTLYMLSKMSDSESEMEETSDIEFRVEVEYDAYDRKRIARKKSAFLDQIEQMEDDLNKYKEVFVPLFRPNHRDISDKVYTSLMDKRTFFQIVIGRTQSGKTRAILCMIQDYVLKEIIDISNIYIITGLSSVDWVTQTKERMPESLHKNIYHNGQLKEFKKSVEGKRNVLVFIDEGHMASKDKQTINTIFKELK